MPEIEETIFAPEPVGGQWLQGGPVSLNALRGKGVALIDFWDYTCVNCIRTLPYVVQWHQPLRRRRTDRGRRTRARNSTSRASPSSSPRR